MKIGRRKSNKIKVAGILPLPLLLLLIFPPPAAAIAHSGGVQRLANAPAGNYWLSAWTQPPALQAGETAHITLTVAEPPADPTSKEAGAVIADVIAYIAVTDSADNTVSAVASLDETAVFYEADITLENAGIAHFVVTIEGERGVGVAEFEAEIMAAGSFPRLLAILAVIFGLFLTISLNSQMKGTKTVKRVTKR